MNYSNRPQYTNVRQPYSEVNTASECCCNNPGVSRVPKLSDPLECLPLASSYTPWQRFENLYPEKEAICYGTIFRELYLPFTGKRP